MKLNSKEFKRFQELGKLIKSGKADNAQKDEYNALLAKRNEKGSNNLEWWKNYPVLLKDVTNLPFNWIPGTNVTISDDQVVDDLQLGVLAVAKFIPTPGRCVSESDAFNAQMRQLWLDMHRKYRGIGTYEKSDLAMAILAINSAFTTISKFERIYGVINTYHVGNRVVPRGLKEALKIAPELEENLADFRYTLNYYVEKLKQLCLPKGLSIMEADMINVSNIFKDSQNRRAFLFLFDTDVYYVYDPTTLSTGGSVKSVSFTNKMNGSTESGEDAFTLSDVRTILQEQIDVLLSDDDIARICSDLLAAYGTENTMTIQSLPEDYKIEPVCDYERSLQFHNLTICGNVSSIYEDDVVDKAKADTYYNNGNNIVIYQKDNEVHCRIGCGISAYTAGTLHYPTFGNTRTSRPKVGEVLFDTWAEDPGEMELMCGTRFTSIAGNTILVSTGVYRQEVDVFGTAVVTRLYVYNYSNSTFNFGTIQGTVVTESSYKATYYDYFSLSQLDWHPIIYVYNDDDHDLELFGDVDNFCHLNYANLARIHEVALLSGFKIPMVREFNSKE